MKTEIISAEVVVQIEASSIVVGSDILTKVYFVRHAQPLHSFADDRTRPLTEEGYFDAKVVLDILMDKNIDTFYSSPYKRSVDTITGAADFLGKNIITDERLRERESGPGGNNIAILQLRWSDHDYHEDDGESIAMVQKRNIEALNSILKENRNRNVVIGTHGTALSTILNYYDNNFEFADFMRIIDWMPYVLELDFDGTELVSIQEHIHLEKIYSI